MNIFLWFLYMVIGMIISIPYCLLAGWSWENWPIVAFVAPAFLFVWMVFGTFAGHIYPRHDHKRSIGFSWRGGRGGREMGHGLPGSKGVFWAWTAYGLLPIIIHWGAVLIDILGHKTVATTINAHRYASPMYVLLGTMLLSCLIAMTVGVCRMIKNGWTRFTTMFSD